jgi:hypothetical protein
MISLQSYEPGALRVPLKSPVRENRTPGSVRGRPGNRAFLPRYDPANGRWINRDPIGENGGLNLYGMLGSDLINAYDLFGFAPVLDNPHTSDLQSGQKMLDLARCDRKK